VELIKFRVLGNINVGRIAERTSNAGLEFAASVEEALRSGRCEDAEKFAFQMTEELGAIRGQISILVEEIRERERVGDSLGDLKSAFSELREHLDILQDRSRGVVSRFRARCRPRFSRGTLRFPNATFTPNGDIDEDEDIDGE